VRKILVTGAAGYLASWIVKQLIDIGHTVHGTVRSLDNMKKVSHLLAMAEAAPEQLVLFEADLLKEGSFDVAMKNCDIVIHTASPYFLHKPKSIQKELLVPAVAGTKNVLDSVSKNKSVKRVIVTSSIVALFSDAKDVAERPDYKVVEQDINNNQDVNYNPYAFSKTQAELIAWKINQQQNYWDLVTVHPGAIFGPSLSSRYDATSVKLMMQFLNGSFKSGVPRLRLGVVDVRDVAKVHVQAALTESAKGKYISVAESMTLLEIANLLEVDKFNLNNNLPNKEIPKILVWLIAPFIDMQRKYVANNVGYAINYDNSRSISQLDINYTLAKDTLNDQIAQLVNDKLI